MISDKTRLFEILAITITGLGKFIFMDWLNWRLPFVLVAIAGWGLYIVYRSRQTPGILHHWGFRKDNFREVLQMVLPLAGVALGAFLLIGYLNDTLNLTWHILPILLLYPIWGVIQQFLIIALLAGNLQELEKSSLPDWLIILLTAVLFGGIHYPYYWLVIGTFLLAMYYTWIYLKKRNLYVLGLFHGWLGAVFFYTVVGRDPFLEMFG